MGTTETILHISDLSSPLSSKRVCCECGRNPLIWGCWMLSGHLWTRTGPAALTGEGRRSAPLFICCLFWGTLSCEGLQECTEPSLKQGLYTQRIYFIRSAGIAGKKNNELFQAESLSVSSSYVCWSNKRYSLPTNLAYHCLLEPLRNGSGPSSQIKDRWSLQIIFSSTSTAPRVHSYPSCWY